MLKSCKDVPIIRDSLGIKKTLWVPIDKYYYSITTYVIFLACYSSVGIILKSVFDIFINIRCGRYYYGSIQVICPFLNWVVVSLLLSCKSSLYILNINILLNTGFANISSHYIDFLFCLLIVSLDAWNF